MLIKDFKNYGAELSRRKKSGALINSEAFSLMNEILGYVYEGDWTRAASREKYAAWVRSGFDYKRICAECGTARGSFDVFLNRQNARLERLIAEPFSLIKQGEIAAARVSFYARTGHFSADTELSYSIRDLLPNASDLHSYTLQECSEEIALLRDLTRSNAEKRVKAVHRDRLAYILMLLGTDKGEYAERKKALISLLISNN